MADGHEADVRPVLQFGLGSLVECRLDDDEMQWIRVGNSGPWKRGEIVKLWHRQEDWCPGFAVPYAVHLFDEECTIGVLDDDYRCVRALAGAPPSGGNLGLNPQLERIPYVKPTLHDASSRAEMEAAWCRDVRYRVSSARGPSTTGCRGGDAASKASSTLASKPGSVVLVYNDNPPRLQDDHDEEDDTVLPEKYLLLFKPVAAEALPAFEGPWEAETSPSQHGGALSREEEASLLRNAYHNRCHEQRERQKDQDRAVIIAEFDYRSGEEGATVDVTVTVSTPQILMPRGASRSGKPSMRPSCRRRFVVFVRAGRGDDGDDGSDDDGDDDDDDDDDESTGDPLQRPFGTNPLAIVRGAVSAALDLSFERVPQVKSLLRRCAEEG